MSSFRYQYTIDKCTILRLQKQNGNYYEIMNAKSPNEWWKWNTHTQSISDSRSSDKKMLQWWRLHFGDGIAISFCDERPIRFSPGRKPNVWRSIFFAASEYAINRHCVDIFQSKIRTKLFFLSICITKCINRVSLSRWVLTTIERWQTRSKCKQWASVKRNVVICI